MRRGGVAAAPRVDGVTNPLAYKPGFLNFQSTSLARWKTALAATYAGTGDARILCIGDSTTIGYGAGGDGYVDCVASAFPTILATLLEGSSQNITGNGQGDNANALSVLDPRVDVGSWTASGGILGLGGLMLLATTNASGPLVFSPVGDVTTFEIYYAVSSGLGTFEYQVDAGSWVSVATSGAAAVGKTTVTAGAAGTHTLSLRWASGGTVHLAGIISSNTSDRQVLVINAGISGISSNGLSGTSPWKTPEMIDNVAANLVILENGIINDWSIPNTLATFETNTRAMIVKALAANADVLLTTGHPSPNATYAFQRTYVDKMKALALEYNFPLVDTWGLFGGTQAFAEDMGWRSSGSHPNAAGYKQVARWLTEAVTSVAGP